MKTESKIELETQFNELGKTIWRDPERKEKLSGQIEILKKLKRLGENTFQNGLSIDDMISERTDELLFL
jgi:hypothetical protein